MLGWVLSGRDVSGAWRELQRVAAGDYEPGEGAGPFRARYAWVGFALAGPPSPVTALRWAFEGANHRDGLQLGAVRAVAGRRGPQRVHGAAQR